ncbi:DEAD/DEAH box helicase [Paenibacillus sp. MAH-36]|uniref:DEAD/DEAH box helicase n=1 Tax=Paenibacillus violae TaxID=3077234 RepID=A0ABU3R7A1_9BACL|nr:DEAD/DEAH box helicase [Paenibacillus sp. PFR10]MDU0200150.1 DEAD/DEAH box helicase [Paenibacillus sp. PFR10]
MSLAYKPHSYQEYAINRVEDSPIAGLFLDMGLGKTVITLTAINNLKYDSFDIDKVLIIAPKRVAEDTWSRESSKWQHTQHLRISKILGTQKKRLDALKADADIYIINRENVPWLVAQTGKKWPFDMVVIDELSSFKNSDSQRWRALRRIRPFIKRIVGLTGTPAPNSLMDLWAQLYLLDSGERLGSTLGGYRDRYFYAAAKQGHVVHSWKQKRETESKIYEAISDICVSMKAEDHLEMPEKLMNYIPVVLDKESRAKYDQLERDLLLPLVDADTTIIANGSAVLSNKLLQMANGAIYDEDKIAHVIHEAKLDKLEDVIESANGKPVLLFYSFKHDIKRIAKRFKIKELKTNDDIAEWNKGNIPLMGCHPASAGHGLNLQDGGCIVVWFGLNWSLELYEQANARLYRQGQKDNVIIHHLVAEGTMDEQVIEALDRKATGQNALMAAVKARIDKYKKG